MRLAEAGEEAEEGEDDGFVGASGAVEKEKECPTAVAKRGQVQRRLRLNEVNLSSDKCCWALSRMARERSVSARLEDTAQQNGNTSGRAPCIQGH